MSIETLHFLREPVTAIRELGRVLKPCGKLALVLGHASDAARNDAAALLREAGLERISVSYLEAERWLYVEGINLL